MVDQDAAAREICDVGRRLYARGLVAGNDGNISVRLGDNLVLCTPTLVCKGLVRPQDLCTTDLSGTQLSGERRRTSELLLHLEIYRGDPTARAVVHAHPPHATAFAVAGVDIPSGILPEADLFLGVIPRTAYETPGGQAFAETVRPFVGRASSVVLGNHGAVSWAPTLERAYWNIEILDACCRILILARQLGNVERIPESKLVELLSLRANFGLPPDPRLAGDGPMYTNPTFGREG
jgi:L-fuculose-phosphate aldolase